ncbi:MAG TPA: hypothetical protein VGK73_32595 [Polyangiaceae bacterium]
MKPHLLFVPLLLALLTCVVPLRAQPAAVQSVPAPVATTPLAADTVLPRGTMLGSRSEERRYAQREAASPDAKQYRGDDYIVISATAIAIILLVIVIIILI